MGGGGGGGGNKGMKRVKTKFGGGGIPGPPLVFINLIETVFLWHYQGKLCTVLSMTADKQLICAPLQKIPW